MYGGPQQTAFVNTIVGLTGIKHYKDLNGGTPNCVSITPFVRQSHYVNNLKRNIVSDDELA
jgi:choline dehydrogenase